jgi:toxin ParE1/3/4
MSEPYFSPASREDLREILDRIAIDKPGAALRHVEKLEDACRALARNPELGTARDDLMAGVRIWSVGNYAIFFRSAKDGIEVIRVVHGARDFDAIFK